MNKKKKTLFFVMFILTLIFLIFINSFFVSSFIEKIQPTGLVSFDDAGVSLSISQSTAITVLRDDFDGDTTDFTVGGNLALQTLTDMTLEHFSYGKIVFNQVVNITQDAYSPTGTLYDRYVDIDSNLEISMNFISIDRGNLTSLNKSVTITLYRVGDYNSSKILRNGVICPSSVCNLVSSSGGTVIFTVSYLESASTTTYALAEMEDFCGDGTCNGGETCSTCAADCGECSGEEEGGGGGGGGGGETIGGRNVTTNATGGYAFSLKPSIISMDIEKGKSYLQQVNLTNTGIADLKITVTPSTTISRFIEIDEKSFVLKKGESKIYMFHVYSSTRTKADLYTGRLLFSSDRVSVSVNMAINVQELPALFDMKITSTKEYVLPGRIASAEIKLTNIGDAESVDAVLEYGIMDFNNIIYVSRTENITVTRSILTKKVSLKLPENMEMGRYLFYSKAMYEDKITVSNDTFQIEQISAIMWIIALILILLLMILVFFAIILIKKRKKEKELKNRPKSKIQPSVEEGSEMTDLVKDLLSELKKTKSK